MIINGNNIEKLKDFPDNYFDSVVTDPPYGLGKEPDAAELMKDWVEKGYHEIGGTGFMGKEWDSFVPQPNFWKEVFRVLKHGGHVLSFFGTRTYDWGVMAMRFAGFEIRDCIYWHYGSGFPKSHNISKAIDKMHGAEREVIGEKSNKYSANKSIGRQTYGVYGNDKSLTAPATEESKQWDGWGSALKPATEPIVLARKPLEKGLTIAENVLKWGTGAINIDGCRIRTNDDLAKNYTSIRKSDDEMGERGYKMGFRQGKDSYAEATESTSLGRFPANLILTHHSNCELKGFKKVGSGERKNHEDGELSEANEGYKRPNKSSFTHKDSSIIASYGEETVEHWECVDDCPIKILDEQSGISKSNDTKRNRNTIGSFGMPNDKTLEYNDKGGASRFFYVAKASKAERNRGLYGFVDKNTGSFNFRNPSLSGRSENAPSVEAMGGLTKPNKNFHPTVKPVKLMQFLVRLVTPPNGKLLDPFGGSGTTGVACKLEGFDFVLIEQDQEYVKIADARIKNYIQDVDDVVLKEPIVNSNKTIQIELFSKNP